jgi:hypothetical protein
MKLRPGRRRSREEGWGRGDGFEGQEEEFGQRRENHGGWCEGEGAGDWAAPERNGERPVTCAAGQP